MVHRHWKWGGEDTPSLVYSLDENCRSTAMRTNIDIDSKLVRQVMKINPNLKTKKDAVNFVLLDYVHARASENLLDLMGADLIDPEYHYKATR